MNIQLPIKFSDKLRALRAETKLLQIEVGLRAGLRQSRLCALETGSRTASVDELSRLGLAYHMTPDKLIEGTDWAPDPPRNVDQPAYRSLLGPCPALMRGQVPFETHLKSAWKLNSRLVRDLWDRIAKRADYLQIACFLRDMWVDSGVEVFWWLHLAAAGAQVVHLSPQALGLRAHPAVCGNTDLPIGDLPHPALWLPEVGAAFFYQIRIVTKDRPRRVDCLICFGHNRWSVCEIDGGGHNARWDFLRDESVAFPVWRWTTSDVQDRNLVNRIVGLFRGAFPLAFVAKEVKAAA